MGFFGGSRLPRPAFAEASRISSLGRSGCLAGCLGVNPETSSSGVPGSAIFVRSAIDRLLHFGRPESSHDFSGVFPRVSNGLIDAGNIVRIEGFKASTEREN